MALVGIVSDTHGLLRPEVLRAFRGVSHIIHAGDVGDPAILHDLEKLAPVSVVRGNTDRGEWVSALPVSEVVEVEETLIFVIHDLAEMDLDPEGSGFQAVVSGHTHQPEVRQLGEVLYVNPGSAGPVRGSRPVSLALAEVRGETIEAHVIPLLSRR